MNIWNYPLKYSISAVGWWDFFWTFSKMMGKMAIIVNY